MKRLKSVTNDQVELEVVECGCGFHLGVDSTYLDQVDDLVIKCPSCSSLMDSEAVFNDMKTYSFKELKKKYKERAMEDYEKGWLETHSDSEDRLSRDEIHSILLHDLDGEGYSRFGKLLESD